MHDGRPVFSTAISQARIDEIFSRYAKTDGFLKWADFGVTAVTALIRKDRISIIFP